MDSQQEAELLASAEAWVAEVDSAYSDGGYAAGDGPRPPIDEMKWLMAERSHALLILEGWHSLANHLERIVESAPHMRAADVYDTLQPDRDRLDAFRRSAHIAPR